MKQPKTLYPKFAIGKKAKSKNFNKRKHLNQKFYESNRWRRKFKPRYIEQLRYNQYQLAENADIHATRKLEIINHIPVCEQCLDRYMKEFQPGLNQGKELDHIKPVNPTNALDTQGKYGEPFDTDNVQLLCVRCHAEKSAKDKYELKRIEDER